MPQSHRPLNSAQRPEGLWICGQRKSGAHNLHRPSNSRRSGHLMCYKTRTSSRATNRRLKLAISFLGFPRIARRDLMAALEGRMRPKKHETRVRAICSRSRARSRGIGSIAESRRSIATRAGRGSRHGLCSGCCSSTSTAFPTKGCASDGFTTPIFQYFTGEEFFQHIFPHERSDLSHWRKRLGDKLELLLAESLRVAHESGALRTKDREWVTVETTVQPKAITCQQGVRLRRGRSSGDFCPRNSAAFTRMAPNGCHCRRG
jgi:hypothetical protein